MISHPSQTPLYLVLPSRPSLQLAPLLPDFFALVLLPTAIKFSHGSCSIELLHFLTRHLGPSTSLDLQPNLLLLSTSNILELPCYLSHAPIVFHPLEELCQSSPSSHLHPSLACMYESTCSSLFFVAFFSPLDLI